TVAPWRQVEHVRDCFGNHTDSRHKMLLQSAPGWVYSQTYTIDVGCFLRWQVTLPLLTIKWESILSVAINQSTAPVNRLKVSNHPSSQRGPTMAEQTTDRELKNALSQIEKQFGKGAIMQLGEHSVSDVPAIPTGALSLDIALGGRGIPRGRIIEIFGPEASGKTTVALHVVANAQKQGGVAAFIDAEHALDPAWAKRLGVDLEGLLVSQPGSAEEALKIAEMLIKSNAVDIIVIDSVAALVPRSEVEGEIGDAHVGLQARLMSQAMRMLNPAI